MTHRGKIWGRTEDILDSPLCHIAKICIEPRSTCSWHKHERKWNFFYVVRGYLVIEVQKGDYDLIDRTRLGPGDATTVPPGELHRFITGNEAAEALEVYYLEPLSTDIVRQGVGTNEN